MCFQARKGKMNVQASDNPLHKSFRRDILRGYLKTTAFVLNDLDRKLTFRVYTTYQQINLFTDKDN